MLVEIVMCLNAGSKFNVCSAGDISELFDIAFGTGGVDRLLYADDLFLTGEKEKKLHECSGN